MSGSIPGRGGGGRKPWRVSLLAAPDTKHSGSASDLCPLFTAHCVSAVGGVLLVHGGHGYSADGRRTFRTCSTTSCPRSRAVAHSRSSQGNTVSFSLWTRKTETFHLRLFLHNFQQPSQSGRITLGSLTVKHSPPPHLPPFPPFLPLCSPLPRPLSDRATLFVFFVSLLLSSVRQGNSHLGPCQHQFPP